MLSYFANRKLPQVTVGLIAVSLILALLTRLGAANQMLIPFLLNWAELFDGQVWRLITPIFLHFGLLHLIFNMLWLWELGGAVEFRLGWPRLVMIVVIAGVLSNLAQLAWAGPWFGGMSGVVYALLGYVWMQSRFNPWLGLVVAPPVVAMMLAWFLICWTGLLGPIANMAHTVGLLIGVLWGFAETQLVNRHRKP